jgi:hypothetical protein
VPIALSEEEGILLEHCIATVFTATIALPAPYEVSMLDGMPMSKDTDWVYRAVTCPWLSADPVNLVVSTGRGFNNIFDDERAVDGSDLELDEHEFVAIWQASFPGFNKIAWCVFRKRG